MASANETPRQKMIGMMYLVLTALLALNVNSAILQKFKLIDDSLVDVNGKTDKAADGTVKGIQEAVAKNRNQAADQQVLKQSEEIREKTKEVIAYIDGVRDKLITATENSKAGEFHNMEATDKVAITMLGGAKNGLAYPLKDKLNGYADYIKQYVPDAAPLALDAKVDPKVTDKEQKGKNFAEFNFENTPVVAALAVLSQKETEVLKYQADALQKQAEKVGAKTIVFDKLGAFASAESNTVAAGTKYKAELFLTAAASCLKQNMTYNGSPLAVDSKTNHGKIEFTARPGNFDASGNAKANWTGSIRINQNGRDTTFRVTVPYTVTKPVMQIQSASVQALYYKCGNKLSVQVPALGAQYQPSFSASGASVITCQKGEVTLVPNAREVTLNVSSGGNAIGSQTFQVRPIPKPSIEAFAGGRPVNDKQGTPGTAVRSFSLKAIPDAGFATFLPDDARFRVSRYEITLVRGKRPALATKTVNGPQADLSDVVNAYREGDRLYVEVKDVQRQNFQGNVEAVNMTRTFNIPLL